MANDLIRIFSDVHYGDRSSRVRSIAQLTPLFEGANQVILNGDSLDTRIGPYPQRTAELRAEATEFFARINPNVVLITGNHDPDISAVHTQVLAEGRVFVTHGDVLFESIVPWGRDASRIRRAVAAEQARFTGPEAGTLETRFKIFRQVCASVPQRHQTETNRWKHLFSYSADTFWPPSSAWRVLWAWHVAPRRAADLIRTHSPQARFILNGHTHRPGIWRMRDGRVVINTGAFSPPFGAQVVELRPDWLTVRRIVARDGSFHPGAVVAEFALAEARP